MKLAASLLLTLAACSTPSSPVAVSGSTTTTVRIPVTDPAPRQTTTTSVAVVVPATASPPVIQRPGILARIAECESIYGQYTYRDHGHATSTASGKYGFLDSTWLAYRGPEGAAYARAFHAPEWVQDAAALRLFNELGTRPWRASQACWSN